MPSALILGCMMSLITTIKEPNSITMKVPFTNVKTAGSTPELFELKDHIFQATQELKYDLKYSGVEVFDIRFPSPVETSHTVNNTVHCELYLPKKPGKFPAMIVLDILDGRGIVSRGEAMWLAQNDVAALVVWMPYYGPRRPTEGRYRLLSPDIDQSLRNVRQTVLDCRRATAFLTSLPSIDTTRIGVVGTSLGSFMGGLVAASEPRIRTACLLLGGGGLVDAFWEHPQAVLITQVLELAGISKTKLNERIAPADPLTYAEKLKGKHLLLIAASRDDVVPPVAMKRLWEATGQPKILWYDSTHVGAAVYAFPAMNAIISHIKE
jgi:dienelactone hydrolase